jgi:hypothetical protein
MLDGTALKTAAEKISNVKVGSAQSLSGDKVRVPVNYTLDGSQLKTDFTLEKTGTQWLFFNTWAFAPSTLPTVNVAVVNSTQATMYGVPVNMPDGKNNFAVFYPGAYEASYKSKFFEAPPARTTVTSANVGLSRINLATAPTPAMIDAVSQKIHQFLDECAQQAKLLPSCPWGHDSKNRIVSPIQWSIAEYPKISINAYAGNWVMAPLAGKARVVFKEQDLFTGAINDINVVHDFGLTSRLTVTDAGITVTPVVQY